MPTKDQVLFHNQQEAQRRAQEAAIAQQASAQQAQQQYGIQSALSAQGAQQQAQLASHHVDLQARLQEVTLNQQEQMRLQRMHAGRAAIEDNADLAPSERRMLITQLESGINPLENRQRESQMISAHLQQQGLAQQTQQQATLFNQRQERLAAGLQGRMQVVADPLTGRQQLFQMDLEGNMQPLDFSQTQAHREMEMQHMQTQIEGARQQQSQAAELQPGRVAQQDVQTQAMSEALNHARTVNPLDVNARRLANESAAQHIAQSPERFNMDMIRGYTDIAGLRQALNERVANAPANHQTLNARAIVETEAARQATLQNSPDADRLRQRAERAHVEATEAQANYHGQLLMNMPNVAEANQRYRADTEHLNLTNATARANLARLTRDGLPEHVAAQIVDHATAAETRARAHLEDSLDRVRRSSIATPQEITAAEDRLHEFDAGHARRTRADIENREDAVRPLLGLPAANRPARVEPPVNNDPARVRQQAGDAFQQIGQQIGRAQTTSGERQMMQADLQQAQRLVEQHGARAHMTPQIQAQYDVLIHRLQQRLFRAGVAASVP